MSIRRALAISAADRYAALAVGALLLAVISRILTPEEVGVTILGMTIFTIVDILRDIPTAFLVQRRELTREAGRAAFTIMFTISAAAATLLILVAPLVASLKGDPDLVPFFRVLAAALLVGPFERPLTAVLRRSLSFDRVAMVTIAGVVTNAILMIGLAFAGYSFMSFAWALLGSGLASLAVALSVCGHRGMLVPALGGWGEAMRIGGCASAWGILCRVTENLPQLVFAGFGMIGALALYSRAQMIADMPAKLLYPAVWQVALPAMAARQREGGSLKEPLLEALSLLSALQWPALVVLACLAHPATMLLLGPQWTGIVPAIQMLLVARLFAPFDIFVYPVLMSKGLVGRLLLTAVIPLPFYVVLITLAVPYGPLAVAACFLLLVPVYSVASLLLVRGPIGLGLRELWSALAGSALVTLAAAAGPFTLLATRGFDFALPPIWAVLAGVLAFAGWAAALVATQHPLCAEIRRLRAKFRVPSRVRIGARP